MTDYVCHMTLHVRTGGYQKMGVVCGIAEVVTSSAFLVHQMHTYTAYCETHGFMLNASSNVLWYVG